MSVPISRADVGAGPLLGWWSPEGDQAAYNAFDLLFDINKPLYIVDQDGAPALRPAIPAPQSEHALPVTGLIPALAPQHMGDPSFLSDHRIKYAYISGAMANGIGSVEIVQAMGHAGMLGFFGAAGLAPQTVAQAVDQIQASLGDKPYGVNLIHAPQDPTWEEQVVDILLQKQVHLIEASAYLALTSAVVRYRTSGIHEDAFGRIVTPNQIIAKVSRVEVASKFLAPPPQKILDQLVAEGHLTAEQARLATRIPMAQDLTAEADSGGHTDNRPAIALLPTMIALRDQFQAKYAYPFPLRVGLAGGIATPASAMAAFSMGAAFILLGTVHQACLESGSSDVVRAMLAKAEQADVAMAPAADMFEMGVELQVLKRGTMFPMRAAKLYHYYKEYQSLDHIPPKDRQTLETSILRASFEDIWTQTRDFFSQRDPAQIERADRDPKHKMALVFRWYLGKSSRWANTGESTRKVDYQVWCGPAMGAFNEWVKGSFLQEPQNRRIVAVAHNILYGAAVLQRVNQARLQGLHLDLPHIEPKPLDQLQEYLT